MYQKAGTFSMRFKHSNKVRSISTHVLKIATESNVLRLLVAWSSLIATIWQVVFIGTDIVSIHQETTIFTHDYLYQNETTLVTCNYYGKATARDIKRFYNTRFRKKIE